MKIIAICGSPRYGNTEFALKSFLDTANKLGHSTELVLLREKKVSGCRGCLMCKQDNRCKIMDDVGNIINKLKENDLIVFGSPNYFNDVSGLMKNFIDRLYVCCHSKNCINGKKIIGLLVGEENIKNPTTSIFQTLADKLDMYFIGDVYLQAVQSNDLQKNGQEIKRLTDFTTQLLSS